MKTIILFLAMILCVGSYGYTQSLPTSADTATTSVIPEGITFKKGKFYLSKGYTATASDDGRTLTIRRMNGGGGSGGAGLTVYCACDIGGIPIVCGVNIGESGTVSCAKCKDVTCPMFVKPITANVVGAIRWKKLVIQTRSN